MAGNNRQMSSKVIKKDLWGDVVATWDSAILAAKDLGVSEYAVRMWVHRSKTDPVKGYIWELEHPQDGTLCWNCQRATGLCSWSEKFIPVEGWVADRNDIRIEVQNQYTRATKYDESYFVRECPLFVRDKPRKKETR